MKNRKKLIYIISDIDRAIAFEWIADSIDQSKFELVFLLINSSQSYLKNFLTTKNFPVYTLDVTSKRHYLSALLKIISIFRKEKPHLLHAHLFTASLLSFAVL